MIWRRTLKWGRPRVIRSNVLCSARVRSRWTKRWRWSNRSAILRSIRFLRLACLRLALVGRPCPSFGGRLQFSAGLGDGLEDGLGDLGDDVKLADLVANLAEDGGKALGYSGEPSVVMPSSRRPRAATSANRWKKRMMSSVVGL